MDGQSLTPDKIKLEQLKELFPEVFSEGKVDWEKLKATLGKDITFSNERYVLNWAGKSDAFKVLQTPSTRTLAPAKEESINFDETENIFIEGENLEVLKVLQKSYFGKIKMIYIDPPYNTGNDSFIYPDKFSENKEEYLKRIGDKDEDGYMTKDGMFRKNSKENGQYHSNWLNMMYPRLFLAKNLLREDGVIFVSIDDNEVHNLRLMMNEIFGEENFLAQLVWEKIHSTKNDAKYYSDNHEYILTYSKNISSVEVKLLERTDEMNSRYQNPDNDIRGVWSSGDLVANEERKDGYYDVISPTGTSFNVPNGKHWVYSKNNMEDLIKDNRIWFGKDGTAFPRLKRFLSEVQQGRKPSTLLTCEEVGHNQEAKREVKQIFEDKNYFETPKPKRLIERLLRLSVIDDFDSYILDFFSGSSTTAHAVMDLNKEDGGNRKYICVQLPELCDEKSEAFKSGYKTIADIAKERIHRVITKINEEKETLDKETASLLEKVAELQKQIEELKKKENPKLFVEGKQSQEIEKLIKQQEIARDKAKENTDKIDKIDQCDKGFKVLKLSDSNFKQWQQLEGKDVKALEEQMKLFVDPVSESSTFDNMVFELLLKSGKDINSKVEHKADYYCINDNELVFMLENATQDIVNSVLKEQPQKVIALDRLFKDNDQLKTNTSLQMKDAGIEFKTI